MAIYSVYFSILAHSALVRRLAGADEVVESEDSSDLHFLFRADVKSTHGALFQAAWVPQPIAGCLVIVVATRRHIGPSRRKILVKGHLLAQLHGQQ